MPPIPRKSLQGQRWIPPEKRFWMQVHKSSGCWVWVGNRIPQGYGTIGVGGKPVRAHRYSWELHNGPIPDGLFVLHRCDNPPCVRPDHLFLGTALDNSRDCVDKGRHRGRERLPIQVGDQYGRLTVVEWVGGSAYKCSCTCGGESVVKGSSLMSGHTKSCGCYNKQRLKEVHTGHRYNIGRPAANKLDRTGKRYGRLVAIRVVPDVKPLRWLCRCDCGNEVSVLSTNLSHMEKNNGGCRNCVGSR